MSVFDSVMAAAPSGRRPCSGCSGARRMVFLSFLCCFVLLSLLSPTPAGAIQNFNIKIGVAENVQSGKLLGSGLVLKDAKGTAVNAPNGASVAAAGNGVKVGGKTLVLPVNITAKSGLGWGERRYRGTLRLVRVGSRFTVVNEVDLENYLRGILKIEMNPEWHIEALKAQAILARTYAVRNRGRFASKGFDLCATANSQIYRGINGEDPRTDKAVAETKGQILSYGGKPASIFYHSDSGGATADVSHVWGGSIPYLKVKEEMMDYESPYSQWHVVIPPDGMSKILRKMGHDVGAVKSVEVAQADSSGRAVTLKVTGDRGAASVKAHAFRMAAGTDVIRSTNFCIGVPKTPPAPPQNPKNPQASQSVQNSQKIPDLTGDVRVIESLDDFPRGSDPLVEMTKLDAFTKEEIYDMLFNQAKREQYLEIGLKRLIDRRAVIRRDARPPAQPQTPPAAKTPRAPRKPVVYPTGQFLFVGSGWGHGVGLSQWGAKAMADEGMKCADILNHYFPGTKIEGKR